MKINRKKYILSDANYFNKKCKKRKIILTNCLTSDMRFFEGWKLRRNGNYKKVTHYTIDKDGTIHEHFNPEYYSEYDELINPTNACILAKPNWDLSNQH